MKLRSIKTAKDLDGKKVLLRVDFNVGLHQGRVVDDFRIQRALPTIKYLLSQNAQIVLVSHLGRPKGKKVPKYSLKPVVVVLRKYLKGTIVTFKTDKLTAAVAEKIKKSKSKIIVLENLRFDKGEALNDKKFAKVLAACADLYVNDAFAVCHRKAASIVGVTTLLESFAGLNVLDEVKMLGKVLKPTKPAVLLVGGIKVASKFGVIKNLLPSYSKILTGGGVANLFLKARGEELGSSLYDADFLNKAKRLRSKKILVPRDYVIADKKTMSKVRYHQYGWGGDICSKQEMVLDIGPETIIRYAQEIRKAKTIVWGGPMGMIGMKTFSHGSEALAQIIGARSSKNSIVGVAGGGETISVINRTGMGKYLDFISTGGGAMLQFLEGNSLPGLKPLVIKK